MELADGFELLLGWHCYWLLKLKDPLLHFCIIGLHSLVAAAGRLDLRCDGLFRTMGVAFCFGEFVLQAAELLVVLRYSLDTVRR